MEIKNIKTIQDILEYLKEHIDYGYVDIYGNKHIKELKGFRPIYRTMSIEDTIKYGLGTCIEQVALMKYLCDLSGIPAKMFCTRIYESDDFNNPSAEEHMHCFLLAYLEGKVYHIEHPNFYNIGIYEYQNEATAIENIQNYFIELSGGIARPLDEFYEVTPGLTFQEFNKYINNVNKSKQKN